MNHTDLDEQAASAKKPVSHVYAAQVGQGWIDDIAQVLLDEYRPFLDQGYNLDILGAHFLGGNGFEPGAETGLRERP